MSITQNVSRDSTEPIAVKDAGNLPTGAQSLAEVEKDVILATLSETGGNKSETARRLGINRKTLHLKLKRYGLD